MSAVADIDAKSLAARLIRREPAACTGMSLNTRRQGRSPLRDSIPSDLGQRLSKSAQNCRKRKKYVAGTAQALRLAQRRPDHLYIQPLTAEARAFSRFASITQSAGTRQSSQRR